MKFTNSLFSRMLIVGIVVTCSCGTEDVIPDPTSLPGQTVTVDQKAMFVKFGAFEQTLPTAIHKTDRQVVLEVGYEADITKLAPAFEVPDGYVVEVNGTQQISGMSIVNFTKPVTYTLKSKENQSTTWNVEVVPLKCRIVIDASHDGGVWWSPQSVLTGFDATKGHQGQRFADILREKGFEVTELGRGHELTDEMFFGSYIVIRVNGFEPYTHAELSVYGRLLERGMNLAFFTDHKLNDKEDELGDYLGLNFQGAVSGTITNFVQHPITADLTSLQYMVGSVLASEAQHGDNIKVLGRLNSEPVMGILNYPSSKIFFIGDSNGLESNPQPFINNLIGWMGTCFVP